MDRLFTTSGVARITGLPQSTVARRVRAMKIVPDAELVIVTGSDELVNPLFREGRLGEIARAVRQPAGDALEAVQ